MAIGAYPLPGPGFISQVEQPVVRVNYLHSTNACESHVSTPGRCDETPQEPVSALERLTEQGASRIALMRHRPRSARERLGCHGRAWPRRG